MPIVRLNKGPKQASKIQKIEKKVDKLIKEDRRPINRNMAISPSKRVTLKYTTQLKQTASLGIPVVHTFRLNSIFDPDLTGVGHKPYGSNEWGTFYNRYRVYKCKYKLSIGSSENFGIITLMPSNNPLPSGQELTAETDRARSKVLIVGETKVFTGTVKMDKLYGVSMDQLQSGADYASITTSNPGEAANLHILYGRTDNVQTSNFGLLELWYDVEFHDAKQLNQS